jgi:DNA-directed RNA polymerase subunit RPC12/RpoP
VLQRALSAPVYRHNSFDRYSPKSVWGGPCPLSCPQCGAEFTSALRMELETYAKTPVENNMVRCTNCGFVKRYQNPDSFFT